MKSKALEELSEQVRNCSLCLLHRNRNLPVFGQGAPDSPIMLVGEGPGADEDLQGIPFVGRAGPLLDKILLACNFTREKHVYITNIVKCRPPGNRNPEIPEMAACLPYLEQQIELINPKIVVAMGATALKGLLGGNLKITRERGYWHLWMNRYLMPTYHPAAMLRNPNLKKDAWEDFKEVIRKYRTEVETGHVCRYV